MKTYTLDELHDMAWKFTKERHMQNQKLTAIAFVGVLEEEEMAKPYVASPAPKSSVSDFMQLAAEQMRHMDGHDLQKFFSINNIPAYVHNLAIKRGLSGNIAYNTTDLQGYLAPTEAQKRADHYTKLHAELEAKLATEASGFPTIRLEE